jgi:hypothetical protein
MDDVSEIIKRRKKGAVSLLWIFIIMIVFIAWQSDSSGSLNLLNLLLVSMPIVIFLSWLYAVNTINYPTPRRSYRTFNKVIYIYAAKLTVITSILGAIWNIKRLLNPWESWTHPDSKLDDLIEAGADAVLANAAAKQIKPAERVEQYFFNKEQAEKVAAQISNPTATTPQPPVSAQPL